MMMMMMMMGRMGWVSVGESIWPGDYSICKNAYHINYTPRIICKCPSTRCILDWYFSLTSRAVKQPASFMIRELYGRTCIYLYDYTAGGIYQLRYTVLRIAVLLPVMLCSRHQCCGGNRCHRLQIRQLPVPPNLLLGVAYKKTFLNRNTTEWYIHPPTYVLCPHTHYVNPSEPSGCYIFHHVRRSEILRSAHTVYLCVFTDLRKNSDYLSIQH